MYSMLFRLMFLVVSCPYITATQVAQRRIVDLFVHKNLNVPDDKLAMAIHGISDGFAVQLHKNLTELDCESARENVVGRIASDYAVFVFDNQVAHNCTCKDNLLVVYKKNVFENLSFCSKNVTGDLKHWDDVHKTILDEQKIRKESTIPDEYTNKDAKDSEGKAVKAGLAVMGLLILALIIGLVFMSRGHAKEIKKMKQLNTKPDNKKRAVKSDKDEKSIKTDKSEKSNKSSK